ncbi:MAG: hypothetical protein Mars2KO_29010 [Maribacter sp.]
MSGPKVGRALTATEVLYAYANGFKKVRLIDYDIKQPYALTQLKLSFPIGSPESA